METQIQINKISENEIWLNENHFLLDDNNLYITRKGDIDTNMAQTILETIYNLINSKNAQINLCVDLEHSGKTSSEARKIFKTSFSHENINKIALIGTHLVAKMIASFFIGIFIKKKAIKFFKTKKEAMEWFKEQKQ